MNHTGGASYELVVESGSQSGARFAIDRPLVSIGRSADNDIVLEDPMVSKKHARIIVQGNDYLIEDLGSSNGTLVNGQRINSHLLSPADRLLLGETNITFAAAVAATVTTPMPGVVPSPPGAPVPPGGPVVPMPPAMAPLQPDASTRRNRNAWIAVGIIAAVAVIAGVAVLLVLLLGRESDSIKPEVRFTAPAAGAQVQLGLPVSTPQGLDVNITASDDKGLDKVVLYVNDQVVKTFEATTSSKDSKTTDKVKEESFTNKWSTAAPGNYSFRAKAYDWKGNTAETDALAVAVTDGPDIAQAHSYCQQIDGLITEFVQFRQKFNQAYESAKRGEISYVEAGYVFDQVGDERRSLKGRLASISPQPPFAPSHALFDQQIDYAIQADNFAVLWARDMQLNTPYYDAGLMSDPDPNDYEGKMQSASAATQQAAAAFREAYKGERATQLKIGPGPDPNG